MAYSFMDRGVLHFAHALATQITRMRAWSCSGQVVKWSHS